MNRKSTTSAWVAYLLLALVLFITNEIVASSLQWDGMNHFPVHMHRLADALLLALPVLIVPRRWFALPWLIVINIYYLANIWYYRNYGAFLPISQLFRFSALKGLGPSITESMRWRDILIPLPSLAWIAWLFCVQLKRSWKGRLVTLVISLLFITIESLSSFHHYDTEDARHPSVMFKEIFPKAYKKYGLIEYWIVQSQISKGHTDQEEDLVAKWMSKRSKKHPKLEATAEGKNLIMIVVESLSSWLVGHQVDGIPVTPNLDRLIADSTTLYMPNGLTQVKWGRSSDCHLMFETGLLVMTNHVASDECYDNFYYALPKALKEKGYHSECYVCDDKTTWWHQEANYTAYGYDKVTDMLGSGTGKVNYDTCDQYLFPLSLKLIRELPEPFYAKVVTLSMHNATPMPQHATALQQANIENNDTRNYLIRTHYTDYHLGIFLDSLKACGLYDNSLIVIIGDHMRLEAGRNPWDCLEEMRLDESYYVPLIVLNSPAKPTDPQMVYGQLDLYPTLLDLMGVGNYPWRGLGVSVFDPKHPRCATHHTGYSLGETNSDIVDYQKNLYNISDIILRSDYFRHHPLK